MRLFRPFDPNRATQQNPPYAMTTTIGYNTSSDDVWVLHYHNLPTVEQRDSVTKFIGRLKRDGLSFQTMHERLQKNGRSSAIIHKIEHRMRMTNLLLMELQVHNSHAAMQGARCMTEIQHTTTSDLSRPTIHPCKGPLLLKEVQR